MPTDHVDSRGADDIGHPAVERATSAISRDAGNDSPRSENGASGASSECHVDHHTRRTDETCGSDVQNEIISRSRGPAERAGTDDDRIVDTETQHDAQHADVLHTRDDEDTLQVMQV